MENVVQNNFNQILQKKELNRAKKRNNSYISIEDVHQFLSLNAINE